MTTHAARNGADRAEQMLLTSGNYDTEDLATTLADALCDLRHWADRNNVDFGDADNRAYRHYYAEAIRPDDIALMSEEN